MNLYLLTQTENRGYDTFDSIVVAAETKYDALRTSPNPEFYEWSDTHEGWMFTYSDGGKERKRMDSWANNLDAITCKKLGTAMSNIEPGLVLASFNAG
jgi:hypothetical protein